MSTLISGKTQYYFTYFAFTYFGKGYLGYPENSSI